MDNVPQIVWFPEAIKDTKRLLDFLAEKSPEAMAQAAQSTQKRANTLPELGYPMNDGTERREFLIMFSAGSYILRY